MGCAKMGAFDYDAVRVVSDEAYLDAVWRRFRAWYAEHEAGLWVKPEALDAFLPAARLQVIFATTALAPGIAPHAGAAHEWVCRQMRTAFNGGGRLGGNYHAVLAHMVVSLRTGTYANGVVAGEKEAGDG